MRRFTFYERWQLHFANRQTTNSRTIDACDETSTLIGIYCIYCLPSFIVQTIKLLFFGFFFATEQFSSRVCFNLEIRTENVKKIRTNLFLVKIASDFDRKSSAFLRNCVLHVRILPKWILKKQ